MTTLVYSSTRKQNIHVEIWGINLTFWKKLEAGAVNFEPSPCLRFRPH